ncbi:MAG: LysR family transcriptional regulator [Variovorax sp.]
MVDQFALMTPTTRTSLHGIDLAELETFAAVAELGSFSAAATRLHLGQPSVTNRIQRLEEAVRTKLLVRTTRRVKTTPEGARLLEESVKALDALRGLVDSFLTDVGCGQRHVVVASTPFMAAGLLSPILRDYANRNQDIEIKLLDLRQADIVVALESGSADVAVMGFDGEDSRFFVEPFGNDEIVLVMPTIHRLFGVATAGLDQLASAELILIDQYQPMLETIVSSMAARGLAPPRSHIVGNLGTLLGMLEAGMGIALLPRSTALRQQHCGSIASIAGLTLRRNYALVSPRKTHQTPAVKSFCEYLRSRLAGSWPLSPANGYKPS